MPKRKQEDNCPPVFAFIKTHLQACLSAFEGEQSLKYIFSSYEAILPSLLRILRNVSLKNYLPLNLL